VDQLDPLGLVALPDLSGQVSHLRLVGQGHFLDPLGLVALPDLSGRLNQHLAGLPDLSGRLNQHLAGLPDLSGRLNQHLAGLPDLWVQAGLHHRIVRVDLEFRPMMLKGEMIESLYWWCSGH
jgi:hypothetical protein